MTELILKKITINDGLTGAVCLFLFVILPFVYSRQTMDPEIAPRFISISIFCTAMFGIFLFMPDTILQSFRILSQPFFLSLLLWLVVTGFATLKAINPGDGLFLLLQRVQFVWMVIIFSKISFPVERYRQFLSIAIMTSVLIFSFFGFIQVIDESNKLHAAGENLNRLLTYITSTLGNKNFYAETLFLSLPLLVWGTIGFKRFVRILFLITITIALITIALLQSVSVWIALFLAAVLFVVIFFFKIDLPPMRERTLRAISLTILILMAGFLFSVFLFTSFESKLSVAKFFGYFSTDISANSNENDNSAYERVMLWRNTLNLIREYPLLGAGLGNWKIVQAQFGIGGTQFINSGLVHYEHPHNEFLFIGAETGISGLLLFLLMIALLFRLLFYVLKNSMNLKQQIFTLLLTCTLTGLLVLSSLGYPLQRSYSSTLIALLFALIVSTHATLTPPKKVIPFSVLRIFFLFAAIVSSFSIYAGVKRYHAEKNLHDALSCKTLHDFNCMATLSKRADHFFFPVDYGGTPVNWYSGVAYAYCCQTDSAKKYLLKAVAKNPNHVLALSDLGAVFQQEVKYDSAIHFYKSALKITPQFSTAQLNLAIAFYNEHQIDSALFWINKLIGKPITRTSGFKKALGEILYTKAFLLMEKQYGRGGNLNWQKSIEDRNWLISLYDETQKGNLTFDKLLEKNLSLKYFE